MQAPRLWNTCLRTARDIMNGTIFAHIQLVGPQDRQSFSRPNQPKPTLAIRRSTLVFQWL